MQTSAISPSLAEEINRLHAESLRSLNQAARFWWECGKALVDVKESLHGDFTLWLEGNCQFSDRLARYYMGFYRKYISGLPADSEKLKLVEIKESMPADGDVRLGPLAPSYARADNFVCNTFAKWKQEGCAQPQEMLNSITATIAVLSRQQQEVLAML